MIVDVAPFRHLLDVIEVVAVELVKINLGRNIVEFPADQVVNPHDVMAFGNHCVSQVAAEKARDPRNEYLHRQPFSRFSARIRPCSLRACDPCPDSSFFFVPAAEMITPPRVRRLFSFADTSLPNRRAAKRLL